MLNWHLPKQKEEKVMKKKIGYLVIASMLTLSIAACGNKNESEENTPLPSEAETGSELNKQDDEKEKDDAIDLKVYHLDSVTGKLAEEETEITELSTENIISALTYYDMMPSAIEINDFEETSEEGAQVLKLDLPSEFTDFLSDLEGEEEELILKGIANTFLEAYDADKFLFLIDGEDLTTPNATYADYFELTNVLDSDTDDLTDDDDDNSEDSNTEE